MIKLEKDFADFIALCNEYDVRYLVIGGYAVSIHGYPRSTKDLDICIEATRGNADRLIYVLEDFGFGSLRITIDDLLRKDFILQLGYPPLRIDILNDLGPVPFSEAFENKKVVTSEDGPINFIGYSDLLKVKESAGRDQDLLDIKKLKQRNKKN